MIGLGLGIGLDITDTISYDITYNIDICPHPPILTCM